MSKKSLIEEEAVQEGVLNAGMIEEWKDTYKHIFKTTVGEHTFVWHKLRRREYVDIMTIQSDNPASKVFDRQDAICETCVLFPENIEEIIEENGGLAGTIADEVLLRSGFDISDTEEI